MLALNRLAAACAVSFPLLVPPAWAAVSAEEAARLKTTLTPLGAERAGNKDGSIPAWNGGLTTPLPSDKPDGRRGDPFKDEKPLYSITAKNADQHAAKLTDGTLAMLRKYPETYRVDVYKTHRTAAAPQWVYDNTAKNTVRARMEGDLLVGAYAGVPFPIPQNGMEVMWNHMLRWRAPTYRAYLNQYVLTTDGKSVLTSSLTIDLQTPYFFQDGSPEQFAKSNDFWMTRLQLNGPASRAGEGTVLRMNIDGDKTNTWLYVPGQRRVRKLPNVCCDTPNASSSGVLFSDEVEVWAGRLDQFDWKLEGRKEMLVPYNVNKQFQPESDKDLLMRNHLNPDHVRWELHRVWVVEATLRAGKRHQAPRGKYYCDEDTWTCVLADRWDAKGQLWRTLYVHNFVAPDVPAVMVAGYGYYDLLSGAGYAGSLAASKPSQYPIRPRIPDSFFTPDSLAAEGVR
ncbi:DUF1329 domain-containing protein [Piscinibacter sp.]|uniref:DUF1329 domain-containing protein n=1 Tax=Piscinibacter sp. TaxID=1903157 RepID=UPI0039E54527